MRVLSLFDGISCARVALEKSGICVETYYASEIDKYAIMIAQKNYPSTIQLGDVRNIRKDMVGDIDLLIGGSPCTQLSICKRNREGLEGKDSKLFYEFVRVLKEVNPKYFILENVASMSKESKDTISSILGVEPIMIDASLVSAQSRKRLFWTNIRVENLPTDRGIILRDILENGDVDRLKSYCIDAHYYKGTNWKTYKEFGKRQLVMIRLGHFGKGGQANRVYSINGKSVTLSSGGGGQGGKTGLYLHKNEVRKLTPIECERLMGLKDNYTDGISHTQRYKCLGNAFHVDVISHILSFLEDTHAR